MIEEKIYNNIFKMLFQGYSLNEVTEENKISLEELHKIINDNADDVKEALKETLPESWHSKLTNNNISNLKLLNLYQASLNLTPEVLDLKTKHTYIHLLEACKSDTFTRSQAQVLASLLSYFNKNNEEK